MALEVLSGLQGGSAPAVFRSPDGRLYLNGSRSDALGQGRPVLTPMPSDCPPCPSIPQPVPPSIITEATVGRDNLLATFQLRLKARPAYRRLRAGADVLAGGVVVLVTLSLVPSDEAYYPVEDVTSHLGPLGSASQHVRSVPSTASSILMEVFADRRVEV